MNSESEPEPQQVAEEVRRLVVSAGDKGISGSQVGLLLRAKWPSFSPAKLGVATLREFIRNQMSEVKELRRAGGDVIYGLPDVTAKGDREDLDTDLDLWRVWISPLSPFGIAVDPSTGEVRRIFIGDLPEGNVQIKPAPAEAHRSIAKHFLDTRSETFDQHSRASLNEILDNSDARWWKRWNDILKSVSPQITRNWFMFRERAL